MISILVVDDQTLVRQGIVSLLALSDKVTVVAQAEHGKAALSAMKSHQPDVVLIDIRMPVMNGIDAIRSAKDDSALSHIPMIALTTFDDHQQILDAVQSGAKGYLLKDVSLDTLIEAIETVHRGETLLQPAITQALLTGLQSGQSANTDAPVENLSQKEVEVLRLMAAGCSNREIAASTFKSEGTVKNQVSAILAKLQVKDRTRAVLKGIELKLI